METVFPTDNLSETQSYSVQTCNIHLAHIAAVAIADRFSDRCWSWNAARAVLAMLYTTVEFACQCGSHVATLTLQSNTIHRPHTARTERRTSTRSSFPSNLHTAMHAANAYRLRAMLCYAVAQ